ncbi:hypothetical protein PybrP1_007105 [[Pythium] brassicae (nom. inval.)]|nr:hypothetical protein PybrP1_007105 [[Pythium] brassicae (nom. inval.)]
MTLERLSACVDELRAGGSAAEQQAHQRRLLRELYAVARRWSPESLPPGGAQPPAHAPRKASPSSGPLFALLLQTLLVSYGGTAGGSSTGGAGGGSAPMGMALSAGAPAASESVLRLICDLMVRAFDYAAVPLVNEALTGKHTPLAVRTALAVVVSQLPPSDAAPFFAEVVAFASKSVKAADYFLKQRLVESATRVLAHDLPRLTALHPEALRIVNKTFQDKMPEVRRAAAGLLHVLALRTATGSSQAGAGGSSGSGSGSGPNSLGASMGGSGSGSGGSSASGGGSSGGGGHSNSVTHEALIYIGLKGMDDAAPECRRAFAAVVGVVLAKFTTSAADGGELQPVDDDDAPRHAGDAPHENGSSTSSSGGGPGAKSKLAFKMSMVHLSGMSHLNLPGALSRRKAAAVSVSTVGSIVRYLRESVAGRYLTANPNQSHGGVLAAYSVALSTMFEHLPPDTVAESQFSEIIDATLSILDHPFSLGDLTRARNAVCFVLRYGLFPCLTERQQEALLGAYLQKLKEEASTAGDGHHHKLLAILVEMSHMLQAMGEACVSHAQDGTATLQGLLSHEKQSVRFQAAVALASLVTVLPYKLKSVLTSCIRGLRDTAEYLLQTSAPHDVLAASLDDPSSADASNSRSLANLYIVQGRSAAIAHILRALRLQGDNGGGLAHSVLAELLALAELLIESQFQEGCADSVWLTCTRAGWTLVGSLVAVKDAHWVHASAQPLLNLWLKACALQTRESSLELLRIEAAVIALNAFLSYCKALTAGSENVQMLAAYILTVFLSATQERLSNPLKRRGQVARYRVLTWIIKSFVLLPPIFSDSYIVLLDLIAEHTVAQSLTSLRQSPLVPAESTFLHNALSGADEPLEMASTARLVAGDPPSALYSRELNHILSLLQLESALSDTELEVQYMDTFWGVVCELDGAGDVYDRGMCSSFTYVRLVDASVFLFGRIFHFVPEELQLRYLQHYANALADGRANGEVNVASLLFAAVRETKHSRAGLPSGTALWPHQMQAILCEMLASDNARVRRSAGEALGMLASLVDEAGCKAIVQEIERRIAAEKALAPASPSPFGGGADADASCFVAGAAFALACVKRTCGSRVSIDTGLIFRFAGDLSQPLRTWILHSWSIVMESVSSAGGDYEQYIKSTLSLIDAHVLAGFEHSKVNKKGLRWHVSAKVAVGRIVNGVVAALGPDLSSSAKRLREFYTTWSLLRQDGDLRVELEYLKFLEQVVVFAPARFQLADLAGVLSVVSDAFALTSASASSGASSSLPSPSARSSFAASSEHWSPTVLARVNGTARSMLQQVAMSCIRTLVERDPSLTQRYNLQCLLFHALHVEYNGLVWRYLPGVHGMWDFLTFKVAMPHSTRGSADEIRRTILALVDVDAANAHDQQLIVWSLFCRSIAVGESGASSSAGDAEQLMMSPKGVDIGGGLSLSNSSNSGAADDDSRWGFANAGVPSSADKSHATASDATAAQVGVWRSTKRVVSDLVATLPPLSRQVRLFAIECVLRVLELVATSGQIDAALHFDLVAARAHFLRQLVGSESAASGSGRPRAISGNFVCMYLDEFVTLACHAATASADGSELQMFQSVGLKLLHVLVGKFASARDPEVPTADAFLLDPYQAQLTSAIRQALKQSQPAASGEAADLYAPLLIDAYGICGGAVTTRLVQDKVALGRILKMVVQEDFGHAHFIGDEATRVTLSLANLSCIAQLLVASVSHALAHDDGRRSLSAAPLVKVFLTTFASASTYLIDCWKDATLSYGVLMRGTGRWPLIDDENEFLPGGGVTSSKVLRTLLPVPTAESLSSSSAADKFRDVFKRYWPHILSALGTAQVHLPSSFHRDADLSGISNLLTAFAVFHINTSVRERRDTEELMPAIQTLGLLLESVESSERKHNELSQLEFADLYQSAVRALVNVALRATGTARVQAVTTVVARLKRETVAYCASRVPESGRERFYALVGQAALCPAEAFRQMCELSQAAQPRTAQLLEVAKCATAGVVLLHTTDELRHLTVHALGLVGQSYRSVHDRAALHDVALSLSRAVMESTVAFAKSLASPDADAERESIAAALRGNFRGLVRWYQEELVVARERGVASGLAFVLRVLPTCAVTYPAFLQRDVAAFHAAITAATAAVLRVHLSDSEQRNSRFGAHLLRGLHGVVQKLLDVQDAATARWYFAALGALLVRLLDESVRPLGSAGSADAVRELEQLEALLRLLAAQLDDAFGAAFVRLVLPKLAAILAAQSAGEHGAGVGAAVARLLLSFAQTRAAAFKEAVMAMEPARRAALELALRSALTGGASARGGASDAVF